MTNYLPFAGMADASVIAVVGHTLAPGEMPPLPGRSTSDTDCFKAMGIPLLQGRTFQETDTVDAQRVVVIDEFLAKKYWPDQDPVGRQIRRGIDPGEPRWTADSTIERGDWKGSTWCGSAARS